MIFCTEVFKCEIERLCHKNSYKELPKEIIEYFFDKKITDILSGTRINLDSQRPYIKKRLGGSGGYRVYFLVDISKGNVYLMFVHPKSGSEGSENITDEHKAALYKSILSSIENKNLYEVTFNNEKNDLVFTKQTTLKL